MSAGFEPGDAVLTKERRIRVIQDPNPEDPRTLESVCGIQSIPRYRSGDEVEFVIRLIEDTPGWRAAEKLATANNPDWTDEDLPDLYDTTVREQWLELSKDHLLVEEFWCHDRYKYIAYTTPEKCAELGVDWANAKTAMDEEIEIFEQWLEADVWGYVIEERDAESDDDDAWEQIESVWGFYGLDTKTNGMRDHVDEELWEQLEAAALEPEYM